MPTSRLIPLLSHLPTFDPETGDLTVVIETPKGSLNKYDYDSNCGAFRFVAVLPAGMSFPFDFGFVPSSLADDGDPLDVLVLLDASTRTQRAIVHRTQHMVDCDATLRR